MKSSDRARPPWLAAPTTAALLATSSFLAGLVAFLGAAMSLSGVAPVPAESAAGAGPGLKVSPQAGGEADPDLEVPVIEVGKRGESIYFRLGSREVGSAAELQPLLEPLVPLGSAISVRIGHDLPFARSAEAIAACRAAGFATILLVPREPGH